MPTIRSFIDDETNNEIIKFMANKKIKRKDDAIKIILQSVDYTEVLDIEMKDEGLEDNKKEVEEDGN